MSDAFVAVFLLLIELGNLTDNSMTCDTHSAKMIDSAAHFPISLRYRQSLQPYVDPEILEIGYYQPQMATPETIAPSTVAKKNYQCPKAIVLLLLVTSCLLGYSCKQKNVTVPRLSSWQISNVSSNSN